MNHVSLTKLLGPVLVFTLSDDDKVAYCSIAHFIFYKEVDYNKLRTEESKQLYLSGEDQLFHDNHKSLYLTPGSGPWLASLNTFD